MFTAAIKYIALFYTRFECSVLQFDLILYAESRGGGTAGSAKNEQKVAGANLPQSFINTAH